MFKFLLTLFIIYMVFRFIFNAFFNVRVHRFHQQPPTQGFSGNPGNGPVNVSRPAHPKKDTGEGEYVDFEEIK